MRTINCIFTAYLDHLIQYVGVLCFALFWMYSCVVSYDIYIYIYVTTSVHSISMQSTVLIPLATSYISLSTHVFLSIINCTLPWIIDICRCICYFMAWLSVCSSIYLNYQGCLLRGWLQIKALLYSHCWLVNMTLTCADKDVCRKVSI